ncbi:MAG: hypothetical protein WC501_04630 [Candidatus Micrarchaeia archaeon]
MRKDYLILALLSFLAVFLPIILLFYLGLENFEKMEIVSVPLLGILISLTMFLHCKKQIKNKINSKKTLGLVIGLIAGIVISTYILNNILGLTNYSMVIIVISAGYLIRENLKEYSFHEKEFYWGMLGSLILFTIYLIGLVFIVFQ